MKKLLILACLALVSIPASAATYYVSTGTTACGGSACSNSNNGTSKTTAWVSAPGMQNCTSICNSATLNAGDSVIFEGCDTWGTAALSWPLKYGGTSGNPIYYGVDKTWYDTTVSGCASAWTRPIFSPGGVHYSNQTGDPRMVLIGNVSYATLHNIEMSRVLAYGSAQPITSNFVD